MRTGRDTLRVMVRAILALILFASTCLSVAAQQNLDPILEEERRRQLEQRTNELGNLERRGAAPDPGPAQARGGPCFDIQAITVDGVTLLTPQELAAITGKYVPRCLQGADIQAVMRELDAAYADQGYITSKTYIPPQNLQGGRLILQMVEGRVEDILLIDDTKQIETRRGQRQLATAFPGTKGGLFQLRDFEQGLDQMNRLASVEAILKLQPGTEPGDSYVIVQRIQKDRFRGYVRFDNQAARSTGRNRLSFETEIDDLFGLNDTWTLGYSGTENTNALSFYGSVPIGYWTLESDLSYSEYLTPLSALAELFGYSWTGGVRARYVVARGQTTTTELSFGVKVRQSERFINDVRLIPQDLTTLNIGVKHLRLGERARNSYDAMLSIGTPLLGADRDPSGQASDIPRAQFYKVTAGWQRQGQLGKAGTLVTDLRAQWSSHTLYGSEQLSLGSLYTVRGYDTAIANGETGAYIRNDLYLSSNIWNTLPQKAANWIAPKAQTYLFLDAGVAYDRARDTTETAAGIGFGLSWYHKRYTISGAFGVPLVRDDRLTMGSAIAQVRVDVKAW